MSVWVGDLDGYVNLDAINSANEREAADEALFTELENIGGIALLAGKATSAHSLNAKGIPPSEWRWAVHEATRCLATSKSAADLERDLVSALLSLGRPYAISRYAKWERLLQVSAVAASLPYGLKALLSEFLHGAGLQQTDRDRALVREAIKDAAASNLIAYERVHQLRSKLEELIVYDDQIPFGTTKSAGRTREMAKLHRDGLRRILSLARLHFSVAETKVSSFDALRDLSARYEIARNEVRSGDGVSSTLQSWTSRHQGIRNWRLRHIRPLLDLYPFSIRHALARGAIRQPADLEHHRTRAINELALAHCGILLMRRNGRDATRSR
jgi:hypothetical protein